MVVGDPDWHPRHSLAKGDEAVVTYLRERSDLLGSGFAGVQVAYLDAGIMNYVYRVRAEGDTFYLKQALPRVKQHDRLGADLREVSPCRIQAEARALTTLRRKLAPEHVSAVPELVHYDDENNVLWTRETGSGSTSLQSLLQRGDCDAEVAYRLGGLLAAIHAAPLPEGTLWPTPDQDRGNWLRFLHMRTTGVPPKAELSADAHAITAELFREARRHERPAMISHLDAAPKNVLVGADGEVVLLDFELGAGVSDPAYDAGFLAGHYLLMGENQPAMKEASLQAATALERGYREHSTTVDDGWAGRYCRYAALTMLYRLYGSSPAPYLNPSRYAGIRAYGIELLTERRATDFAD